MLAPEVYFRKLKGSVFIGEQFLFLSKLQEENAQIKPDFISLSPERLPGFRCRGTRHSANGAEERKMASAVEINGARRPGEANYE